MTHSPLTLACDPLQAVGDWASSKATTGGAGTSAEVRGRPGLTLTLTLSLTLAVTLAVTSHPSTG